MSDCLRKIQIGAERWTQADQELEDWLQAHGFSYTMGVDYREDAQTDDEWKRYVENVKAYALKCEDEYDFMDVDEHVDGLVATAPSHDIRDKDGRRIAILD
ncbi:MAG: hypothetical protein IJ165_07285 [Proteobacteria bacterium]|nr:hypothetical protein [Pseudomonadota bacterium]